MRWQMAKVRRANGMKCQFKLRPKILGCNWGEQSFFDMHFNILFYFHINLSQIVMHLQKQMIEKYQFTIKCSAHVDFMMEKSMDRKSVNSTKWIKLDNFLQRRNANWLKIKPSGAVNWSTLGSNLGVHLGYFMSIFYET